ncbi:MAG: M23 family metallopeptidase [Oscillospiraceae bacterium]|nr:M23 family metallopeptidase [Oscillospiraceae bacterium]
MSKQNQKEARKLPGFYIALCCCVLVIGIAGYFTEKRTDDSAPVVNTEVIEVQETDLPVFSSELDQFTKAALSTPSPAIAPETYDEGSKTVAVEEETPVLAEAEPVSDYAVDNPDLDETAITVSAEQPVFITPVSGDIIEPFSSGLIYNTALKDWRTHNGIDIAAETGCSVQSVADGVIDKITTTAMGGCVEISHAAGFVTSYSGLQDIENLTEGKEIQSGEVIGTLGDCKGENVTEPHLHFEIKKDGEAVNPADYLPY